MSRGVGVGILGGGWREWCVFMARLCLSHVPRLCHTGKTKQLHMSMYHLCLANRTNVLVGELLQGNHKRWKHFKVGDQICGNPSKQ